MRRNLRYTKNMIVRAGGRSIVITPGGDYTRVEFDTPAGSREFVVIHTGSNPIRFEDTLRSQLRRKGLRP